MNTKTKFRILSLFLIAFMLNFIWENIYYSFLDLYASHNMQINSTILLMLYASFVDAILILFSFLLLSILYKNFKWHEKRIRLIWFSVILMVIAIIIEMRALITDRWNYSEAMPTLFGIGLSPLFQLAITGLITVFIVEKFIS